MRSGRGSRESLLEDSLQEEWRWEAEVGGVPLVVCPSEVCRSRAHTQRVWAECSPSRLGWHTLRNSTRPVALCTAITKT